MLHCLALRAARIAAGNLLGLLVALATAWGFRTELGLLLGAGGLALCFTNACVFHLRECWRLRWLEAIEMIWENMRSPL